MKFDSFQDFLDELTARLASEDFIQGTISQPRKKSQDLKRVRLKLVELRGELCLQFEYQYERVLKHDNIPLKEVAGPLRELAEDFRQMQLAFVKSDLQIMISKKFKILWKESPLKQARRQELSHNRKKQYI